MLKIPKIYAYLCALSVIQVQSLKEAAFTEKLKFRSRHPFVAEDAGHLYSLIARNETHMETYSLDNDIDSCLYDLEKSHFKDVRPAIMQAVIFGGAATTVAGLSVMSSITEDGYREITYLLVWFDLKDCTNEIMKEVLVEKVPDSYPEYQPQLVVYQKTFDLFLIGNRDCTPCRYNRLGLKVPLVKNGEKNGVKDELKLEPGRHFRSFHVRSIKPKVLDQFFYTYSFDNGTSIIRILSPYYRVIRQRYVNDPVLAVAVNNESFAVCYLQTSNGPNRQKVSCERLDIHLKTVHSFQLPIPENSFAQNITISLDNSGNILVGIVQSTLKNQRHSKGLVFFRYDSRGLLRESLDFGDISRRPAHNEPDAFTQLESYVVRDQYCLVVYEEFGYYVLDHRVHYRCIRLPRDKGN